VEVAKALGGSFKLVPPAPKPVREMTQLPRVLTYWVRLQYMIWLGDTGGNGFNPRSGHLEIFVYVMDVKIQADMEGPSLSFICSWWLLTKTEVFNSNCSHP